MSTRHSRIVKLTLIAALVAAPFLGADAGPQPAPSLEQKTARVRQQMQSRITQADRERAADALKALQEKLRKAKAEAAAKLGAAAKGGASAKPSGAGTATLNATSLPPSDLPPGVVVGPLSEYPDYYTTANWAFSPPLRKFVDTLAGLGPDGANNLGNFIPVAVPDTTTYPGSDYYEIELREYQHRFHRELNPTTLRGYVQVNKGTDPATQQNTIDPPPIMYLGPTIVAERDRPVRIKFTNKLPTGAAGKLNIPVDTTVMGSGQGPAYPDGSPCDNTAEGSQCAEFPQNRAVIHLHGGRTPWISDGTPFQYLTPAGEDTPYEKGVSFFNVPDMPDPGPGATTYYYTNQQSARLMFYHDHAWGTTRLNVLVGMAAGLIITDEHERQLVRDGVLPPLEEQIPLIIQDRTFVDASDVRATDPTWNWGSGPVDANGVRTPVTGDLWIPHVYMPAQNPYALDYSGANPFGRWVYGPWFFPPTDAILYPPIANPYHDPNCDSPIPEVFEQCTAVGQPPLIPATPRPSVGMETFFDTQTVNGVAFPTTTVQPKTYRLRILNASNDRFVNLSLFEADPTQVSSDGRENTEIKMLPASAQYFDLGQYPLWPTDGREGGVPDPTKSGPPFIQIGTESGFLPRPVVVKSQPIGYFVDPTAFWVGNVKDHALLLGPAERADVIVDFSAFAGKTLILYNDAPTAFPALDPRTDFYAGAPDMSDTGGYGRLPPGETSGELQGPQVGFGPNTRTIMQIKVEGDPAPAYDLTALQQRWLPDPANNRPGVFESAQEPIIVGQKAYDGLYTNNPRFPPNWPYWGISLIQDDFLSFETVDGTLIQNLPMEPKGIHDEMGAAFDREYGRMSGNLGMTNPNPIAGRTTFTLYDFTDPATEVVFESMSPASGDGTQIWKVSHNGVDTHPIHFHIFDVQLVNRVGWDGQLLLPDENELGWKETIRISPLMDTIVAIRPKPPALPFNIPDSVRPLNPGIPLGSTVGFTNVNWVTQNPIVPPIQNEEVSFGWEYVWHCHILSHEEMDMMRPIILNVMSHEPAAPTLSAVARAHGVDLSWTDPTPVNYVTQTGFGDKSSEIGFEIQRANYGEEDFAVVARALANQTSYTDTTAAPGVEYRYRVVAYNQKGEAASDPVEPPPYVPTPATGVTLSASAASPSYVGTAVTFTAAGAGSSDPYFYRFSLSTDGGATYSVVQEYGAGATWVLPAATGPGTYRVKAEVRTSALVEADASTVVVHDRRYAPATGVTLVADKASPQVVGTAVTFTASGLGSSGYQYRFWTSTDNRVTWTLVQDWSATATWTLAGTAAAGSYVVFAEVRTDPRTARDAYATLTFQLVASVTPKATGVTLSASVPSPQVVGTPVTFTAQGQGSSGYEYRFWLSSDNRVTWTLARNWSSTATWSLPTTLGEGTHYVLVDVRTDPTSSVRDAYTSMSYRLTPPKATAVTLSASLASPQVVGTPVTFTATGQGSTSYQYRFWLSSDNRVTWTLVQDWATANTWTLPSTTALGVHYVFVDVRTDTTSPLRDAFTSVSFELVRPKATAVTVTPSLPSPQPAGTEVVFTASGEGSTYYEYRFWLSTDNRVTWTLVQDWSTLATWSLAATRPAGTYSIVADVRTNPTSALRDAYRMIGYTLSSP